MTTDWIPRQKDYKLRLDRPLLAELQARAKARGESVRTWITDAIWQRLAGEEP